MTTPRKLLIMCVLTAVWFVIFNLVVDHLSQGSLPKKLQRQIRMASQTEFSALGNSLIEAGFRQESFANGWKDAPSSPKTFNAGLGATGPVEHYLIARQIFRDQPHCKVLIYGYFDFMMTDDTQGPLSDLFGNRTVPFLFEPDLAAKYLTTGPFEEVLFRCAARIPLFVERGALWGKVEHLRRTWGDSGLPLKADSHFGKSEDFHALETSDEASFRMKCRLAVTQDKPLTPALVSLLREATAVGARMYVVEMPMPSLHRRNTYSSDEWTTYRNHIRSLLSPYDAPLIQASEWIQDTGFADPLHLSESGGAEWSKKLGSQILRLESERKK